MNNLIEHNSGEDKHKIIVIGAILLIFSAIVFLWYSANNTDDSEAKQDVELITPENDKVVKNYKNKMEAYRNDKEDTNNASLEFEVSDFSTSENAFDGISENGQALSEDDIYKNEDNKMNLEVQKKIKELEAQKAALRANSKPTSYNTNRTTSTKKAVNNDVNSAWGDDDFGTNNDLFDAPKIKNNISNTISSNTKTDIKIYAAASHEQVLLDKSRAELRLTKDAVIGGKLYKKNTFVYAMTKFVENRAYLTITNINHVDVNIQAIDPVDGMLGFYMKPENVVSEVKKEGSDSGVDDINLQNVPLGNTVKRIFKRKQRIQKYVLLNNSKIILKAQ